MMRIPTLIKLGVQNSRGRFLQRLLLFVGITIGVSVVVAVDLANSSIDRSFKLSTESITGKSTHQIIGPRGSIPQSIYRQIRVDLGFQSSAPVVTDYIKVTSFNQRTMRLLGIDPFVDAEFRQYLGTESEIPRTNELATLLTEPDRVFIAKGSAEKHKVSVGDEIRLETGKGDITVIVAGILHSPNTFTNQALSGLLITDIATAQEILGMDDHISHIDLIVNDENLAGFETLKTLLPENVRVVSSRRKNESVRQMSRAFELNLNALSLLALLVGMFLIYNTVTFSVVQRRAQVGLLRAIGVTRSEVFFLILYETFFWGILGTAAGIGFGILLGTGTVRLVSQTISDLYFTLTVNSFHIDPMNIIKAMIMGIAASVLSAVFPAREAALIHPVEALRRSSLEQKFTFALPFLSVGGAILLFLGAYILSIPTRTLRISFGGLLLVVFGSALWVPFLTVAIMKFLAWMTARISGISTRIAIRNIGRSLSRSGVAIASLMIAISVIVGVGTMVGSFRATVVDWLSDTIRADVYIRSANEFNPDLDPSFAGELRELEGVRSVHTIRSFRLQTGQYANSTLISIDEDTAERTWLWTAADKEKLSTLFDQGWVFISEPFAWQHRIEGEAGLSIELITDEGPRQFRVAGIFRDYTSERGIILMKESTFQRYWNETGLFGISLFAERGTDVDDLIGRIDEALGSKYDAMIISNRGLRHSAIEVFDRTFTITVALQILAGLVAFIGVMNTIMSLMLERSREIGVLRANGMTRYQLLKMIFAESGLIGLISGVLSLPLGTAMAWILVLIINKRSFGWTLDFVLQFEYYGHAMAIAIVSSLLAGIYPAYKMANQNVSELLRTE